MNNAASETLLNHQKIGTMGLCASDKELLQDCVATNNCVVTLVTTEEGKTELWICTAKQPNYFRALARQYRSMAKFITESCRGSEDGPVYKLRVTCVLA